LGAPFAKLWPRNSAGLNSNLYFAFHSNIHRFALDLA
jgi:hypothetical protein